MTNPDVPDEVTQEEFRMYDADGAQTMDKSTAVSAEVTQTLKDGSTRHTILRKDPTFS